MDQARLPTSSTCVNLLKVGRLLLVLGARELNVERGRQLPVYRSEAVLRDKLLKAVYSGAGFDLS